LKKNIYQLNLPVLKKSITLLLDLVLKEICILDESGTFHRGLYWPFSKILILGDGKVRFLL